MSMLDLNLAFRFAAALGLGMLLGLERQRTQGGPSVFAGVRTMALVALLGGAAVFLIRQQYGDDETLLLR